MKMLMTFTRIFCFTLLFHIVGSLDVIVHKGNLDDVITFSLPVYRFESAVVTYRNFTFSKENLKALNASVEQAKAGKVEVSKNRNEDIVMADGRRIPLKRTVFETLDELKEDPSLKPRPLPAWKWKQSPECHFRNPFHYPVNATFAISINGSFVSLWADNTQVVAEEVEDPQLRDGQHSTEDEGLILTSINLRTCRVTFQGVFPMNQFGSFRLLNQRMNSISSGSLVVLLSMFDGSLLLKDSSREIMASFGGSWTDHYRYRDGWTLAFVKGGKVFADALIPNLGEPNAMASPFNVQFEIDDSEYEFGNCTLWPNTQTWNARRIFCDDHNGYGSLCDCEDPLYFLPSSKKQFDPNADIPVTILVESRTRHLVRLLENLSEQKGLTADLITISMDGLNEGIAKIGYILGIRVLHHRIEGTGGTRISRLLRFSLFNQLQLFPEANFVIQLEDDLVLAKDFYSYMRQAAPVFALDPSIWCVSAFNILAFPHSSHDSSRLYRGQIVPSLGWMMPRSVILELLLQWPSAQYYHNWDFFMARPNVNKNRQCVVPDVIRSNHPNGGGTHFGPSFFMEWNFARKQLNEKDDAILQDLKKLIKENYVKDITTMAANSIIIEISKLRNLPIDPNKNQTYTIYLNKTSGNYENTSRVLHNALGVWNCIQLSILEAEKFSFYNATILIISVPSPYSKNIPADYKFYTATESDLEDLLQEERDHINEQMSPLRTHQEGSNLPFQNIN